MVPKEHGAYGQLIFPLVTSLFVAGPSRAGLLTAAAAIAAFVSHEPLLVLLGRRGPRAAREAGRRALIWWSLSSGIAIAAGVSAILLAPADARGSFIWPLLAAAGVAVAIATHRDRTTIGELCVAATFSAVALPMCRASGASTAAALSVTLAFLGVFAVSTLSVRVVILTVRGGGNPAGVLNTRWLLFALLGVLLAVLVTAGWRGALPWAPLIAIVPSWTASVMIAVRPPAPTRLRAIGWTLMSASATATLILIVSLAGRIAG